MAATDGFRLSVRRTVLPLPVAVDQAVIIPARALAEVARIAGEADQERAIDVAVSSARSQVLFRLQGKGEAEHGGFHHVDLVSQLIDAKFPDFNAIIPKNSVTRSIVDTAALAKAVRAASLFVPGVARNVRLSINPGSGGAGSIALAANSPEMGDTASEIDAEIEGGPLEIAFNARYMQDVLNVVGTPRVLLETTQNNRPGLIRPIGAEPEEFLHVIMPMQLQK
jgi:DNA polymerase-3 subunit beta